MMLPEEDSIVYLSFFGIEPPPAIMGEEAMGPKTRWEAFVDEVEVSLDSRERAYQDEMRRG